MTWGHAAPELGDPGRWNWPAVTSASGRLNRAIRKIAVSRIGARPVLPHAARLITEIGLRYEYGNGIHAVSLAGRWRSD